MEITVTTQAEIDSLPSGYSSFTTINIKADARIWLSVSRVPQNAQIVAWGSSHVEARESVSVQLQSDFADVLLFDFAVCIALAKGKIKKESKTATIVRPKKTKGLPGWFDTNGVKSAAKVVLFKRVSKKFQTQEGKKNETTWSPGSVLALANPNFSQECGEGKFHACSRAYHCDEFRSVEGDRYVAIEVLRKDLHAFDKAQYPYKIAFSRATVLHECDRFGNKI